VFGCKKSSSINSGIRRVSRRFASGYGNSPLQGFVKPSPEGAILLQPDV